MERKAKWDFGVPAIMSLVFSSIGTVYFLVGLGMLSNSTDADAASVGRVFAPLGLAFLAVGVILGFFLIRRKQAADQLVLNGRYVWGTVVKLDKQPHIRCFNRQPYIAEISYKDATGAVHFFYSRHIYRCLDAALIDRHVKVYIDGNSYKSYYVDIDSILLQTNK